jgi:hypothetical protein
LQQEKLEQSQALQAEFIDKFPQTESHVQSALARLIVVLGRMLQAGVEVDQQARVVEVSLGKVCPRNDAKLVPNRPEYWLVG